MLGFERGTVVGHSLGGGIALQFAYQFPEYYRASRARLQRRPRNRGPPPAARRRPSGLRVRDAADRPRRGVLRAGAAVAEFLGRFGVQAGPDLAEAARGYASLADRDARTAFLHTLRAVIDPSGQRVSAADRLYLAERSHAARSGAPRPDHPGRARPRGRESRSPAVASWRSPAPATGRSLTTPLRFASELTGFIETTEPYEFDLGHMREMLRRGPAGRERPEAEAPAE